MVAHHDDQVGQRFSDVFQDLDFLGTVPNQSLGSLARNELKEPGDNFYRQQHYHCTPVEHVMHCCPREGQPDKKHMSEIPDLLHYSVFESFEDNAARE